MFNEKDMDAVIESALISDCIEPSIMREYVANELDELASSGLEEHIRECDLCQRILGMIDEKKLAEVLSKPLPVKKTSPLANRILIKKGFWSDVARTLTEEFYSGNEEKQGEIAEKWDEYSNLYSEVRKLGATPPKAVGYGISGVKYSQLQAVASIFLSVCDSLYKDQSAMETERDFKRAVNIAIGSISSGLREKASSIIRGNILG